MAIQGAYQVAQSAVQDPYGVATGATQGVIQNAPGLFGGVIQGAQQGAQGVGAAVNASQQNIRHLQYLISTGQDWSGQAAATLQGIQQQQMGTPQGDGKDGMGTTIGQSDAWMSPDELGAQTDALQSHLGGNSSGGGGAGGGGGGSALGGAPQGGDGLGLGNSSGGGSSSSYPMGTNLTSFPGSTPINYQQPIYPQNQAPGQGMLQMQQASPLDALSQYKNTAGYQLLNDPNAYQQSPGYQFAVNDALKQVQQNASARGMLESGSALRDMTDRAQGMALQDYGNWWNRQNQLYGDYQNRLAGLAGGDTGAANAMQTGQNLAAGTMQTGSNLGSLFGNQGTTGMSGIINTGAAQSNNMMNAGNSQAQVNAANQATQLAGATINQQQQTQRRGLF